jgi:hypothetical protein
MEKVVSPQKLLEGFSQYLLSQDRNPVGGFLEYLLVKDIKRPRGLGESPEIQMKYNNELIERIMDLENKLSE